MRIFIAYRFTGEDIEKLNKILSKIKNILKSKGADVFCSLFCEDYFRNNEFSTADIYQFCLEKLKEYDTILFFIKSEERSVGMESELKEAISGKKRIVLVIQKNLSFEDFREKSNQVIEYDQIDDLYELLNQDSVR